MTLITIDDELIKEVIAVSHYQNAQEAVINILADYLQQHKKQPIITELLAMPEVAEFDFNPPRLTKEFEEKLKQQASLLSTQSNENIEKYQAIMQIAERCASLPELDSRSADEILGYDKSPMGLWGDE